MTKIVCTRCRGRKTIINMGMMTIKCTECDGEGRITKEDSYKNIEETIEPSEELDVQHQVVNLFSNDSLKKTVEDCVKTVQDNFDIASEVFKKKRGRPPVNKD
jgi:DnaJ-class molecular chaperone